MPTAILKLKPTRPVSETPEEKAARLRRLREARRVKAEKETLDPRWPDPIPYAGTNHAKNPPKHVWDWDDPLACELIRERWDDQYLYGRKDREARESFEGGSDEDES